MLIQHVRYLVDPQTHQKLRLVIFLTEGERVKAGILVSSTDWYPIIDGIPRLLIGKIKQEYLSRHFDFVDRFRSRIPKKFLLNEEHHLHYDRNESHQLKTASSFAYEWNNIYQENSYEKSNYLHFLSPFISQKDLKNKVVLDAGCGSGRFTKQAALMGAKLVVGSDLGETVDKAYQLTRNLKNVLIVQSDIYDPPFARLFDLVHSIGVLHHLPRPQDGFAACSRMVKTNGRILIWVYSRRHNNRALYFYEPLRTITRLIPKRILYRLCYIPALLVHLMNLITKHSIRPPFGYYRNFSFNMKLNDAFDVLATPKSNYYLIEDIRQWFKSAGLSHVRAYEHPEAGITCIGTHET